MSLTSKGKDFDAEINAFAQQLYERNVPMQTKHFIASVEGDKQATGTETSTREQ